MTQTTSPATSEWQTYLYGTGAILLLIGVLLVWIILHKGRLRPGTHAFRASRLSKGNFLFPSQVIITPTSITMYHPEWIGKIEKSIHMAHVSSINIDTNILFSNVFIETTGGHNPIACYGHHKKDALEMKRIVEKYQSEYYQTKGADKA